MRRTVKINKIGTNGVGLVVIFHGHPPVGRLDIKTGFASFSQGYPENDDDTFITVWSPAFQNTEDAQTWLSELTEEVKELARNCDETIANFKHLESVEEV